MAEAYIVDAGRTAGGRRNGKLAGWHPADLGGEVLNALVDRTGVDPAAIDDVIMGCVTQAGEQAFAFGRSSQQAVQFAAQAVMSGMQDIVIAAGVESMTRVPMFSNVTLHQKAGLGVGPLSDRIKARYGVEAFSRPLRS